MAASGGHTEIIKYLQSKGCDVSVKDKVIDILSGALHMAASGGHTEIIKYLQSKGCDVSVKDKVIDLLSGHFIWQLVGDIQK